MPLFNITKNETHYHTHTHHYSGESEQLRNVQTKLGYVTRILETMKMIPKEVQDMLDQAKKNNDLLASMDLHYNALARLVGTLQTTIADLRVGSVLTQTDKDAIMQQTSELAATATTASGDIAKNTFLEGASDGGLSGGQPQPGSGSATDADTAAKTAADAKALQDAQDAKDVAAAKAIQDAADAQAAADKKAADAKALQDAADALAASHPEKDAADKAADDAAKAATAAQEEADKAAAAALTPPLQV